LTPGEFALLRIALIQIRYCTQVDGEWPPELVNQLEKWVSEAGRLLKQTEVVAWDLGLEEDPRKCPALVLVTEDW
jgi:hypothetical protein